MRSLRLRIPALAIVVLALSLAASAFIAYELLLLAGQDDQDEVLRREKERFEQMLRAQIADGTGLSALELVEAASEQYLQLTPDTESYLPYIELVDGQLLVAAEGPDDIEELRDNRRLPTGEPNVLTTVTTDLGAVRVLSAPIDIDGTVVGTYRVAATVTQLREAALAALSRLFTAAGISLLVGALILTATLWTALRPLRNLADTAKATELTALGQRVREPERRDEVGVLAREFNLMLSRLDAAVRGQREFMASVSHELRTPITIARGHLEVLESTVPDDPDAVAETTAVVREELNRMARLVEDLMALARSESTEFLSVTDVDLLDFTLDLRGRIDALDGRHISIVPAPPAIVRVDPDRLTQAVLNLVVNVLRHTPTGTPAEVRTEVVGKDVRITVSDRGPGIPHDLRDAVFEPFVKGEARGSTGLGLAVVGAVAGAHGGHVQLDTSPHGTSVALVLPVTVESGADDDLGATQHVDPGTTQRIDTSG